MKEEQHLNKIAKYLSDNIDSKEREELFAWIKEKSANKKLFEDSLEVWEVSEEQKVAFQPDTEVAWGKMEQRIGQARNTSNKEETIIRSVPFIRPWMRIAAAALVILGVAWWLFQASGSNQWVEERTLAQEKTTIDLPDGSKVWLNQNSKLSYEKFFDKRIVLLEGEAFFEVTKMNGKPFEIFAGNSKTKVLGTSFNVRAYPNEKQIEVTVETGKVAFSAKENPDENAILEKKEYATFNKRNQKVEKEKVAKINAIAWKKGALRFNNTEMEEVIESLERYYDIKIEVSNNKIFNCTWNSTSTYNRPVLEDILKAIDYAANNSVNIRKKRDKLYLFSGTGCK